MNMGVPVHHLYISVSRAAGDREGGGDARHSRPPLRTAYPPV